MTSQTESKNSVPNRSTIRKVLDNSTDSDIMAPMLNEKAPTMLKLSKTSKLDNIMSWSLAALDTCPGSVKADGTLVDACSGCYATTGFYNFGGTKALRVDNKQDWKRDGFVNDFISALKKQKYFRWFDSGDLYSVQLAEKIYQIMVDTPHVQHWLPTRMAKFTKFADILAKMSALPNVKVRFSSDSITGEYTAGVHGSVIIPSADQADDHVTVCRAYEHDGKCNGCRACYAKDVDVIAYPQHGKKMAKVFKLKLVA